MTVTLAHYLYLAAILFAIGLYGVVSRRNAIVVLIGLEIMLNAANINLIAFWRYGKDAQLVGPLFTFFGIAIAAAEVAVGLAIILSIYRSFHSINVNEVRTMKG